MGAPKRTDCPTQERLRGLLSGELPSGEQEALTRHLEGCPACQETLDGWLASPSVEGLAAAGAESVTKEAALRDLMARVKNAIDDATQAETKAQHEEFTYLQPSSRPGHLGRLGHYEIQEAIGQGAFGIVLKAFDEKLHRVVAIKVLSPQLATSGTARQRFIREARAAAAITHEHVVTIHAVEEEHRPPYLVMQFVDGQSLQDKLDRKGPLELKEILRIGIQIAEGLAAAHKHGLVHRDIKPGNILLENGVERVKITDFGLARAVDDASLSQSGVVAGTPLYMSPEQAEGLAVDHRSDLFSLGTVLYAMCTGYPPFRASGTMAVLRRVIDDAPRPIREINNEVPEWLCAIIEKLHAKKSEERFQSAGEVAELLEKHLAHLQRPSQVAQPAPLPKKVPGKGHRVVTSLALASVALGLKCADAPAQVLRVLTSLVLASLGLPSLCLGICLLVGIAANTGQGWMNVFTHQRNGDAVLLAAGLLVLAYACWLCHRWTWQNDVTLAGRLRRRWLGFFFLFLLVEATWLVPNSYHYATGRVYVVIDRGDSRARVHVFKRSDNDPVGQDGREVSWLPLDEKSDRVSAHYCPPGPYKFKAVPPPGYRVRGLQVSNYPCFFNPFEGGDHGIMYFDSITIHGLYAGGQVYVEVHLEREETVANPTAPFVVFPPDAKSERKYATLADAVKAARSGAAYEQWRASPDYAKWAETTRKLMEAK